MAVDLTKYDIGLDAQGYILKPGSYSKKIYHSNTERVISQGLTNQKQEEILLSDASVFRFFSQTDWSGGFNHPQLDADNVFKSSYNIDINRKSGEFRLARQFSGSRLDTVGNGVTTANSAVITSSGATWQTKLVQQGDIVRINTGSDRGSYTVKTVDSETQITLNSTLTTTGSSLSFAIFRDHPILPFTTGAEVMDASETGFDITAIDGLPASGTIRCDGEEMTYTGLTPGTGAGTLTVTRGVNGTTATAHANGAKIEYVAPVSRQLVFNNLFVVAVGKFIFTSSDAVTWTKRKVVAADVTDMVVCNGVAVAACGTDGIYHSKDGTTWTNLAGSYSYLCAYETGGTEYLILTNGSTFSRATYADGGAGLWTVTTIKTLSANETNFLLKPVVFRGVIYVWCNRGSQTLGRADLYIYDSTNFTRYLYDTPYPKAIDMIARENELIFAEDQNTGVAIKSFDGSKTTLLGIMESVPGGTQWGTVQYNTTQYGAGSELVSSPFFGIDFEGRFGFSLKSTSSVNYIYTYEGQDDNGDGIFSRMNLLDALGSNYTSFGAFQKGIWLGDTKGRLRKMQNDYLYSGQLISSEIDVNIPNIKKLWSTIDVLTTSLPANTSLTVEFAASDSGWFTASAHSGTGGTGSISSRFDLSNTAIPEIAAGMVTEKLNYRITLKGTTESSPIVRDINIRYFSVPDRKHVWQMQILAIDNIVLLDNTALSLTGSQLIALLDTTLAKNTTVVYEDYDGTSYTVLCDRNYNKESWIEADSGTKNAVYTINLLET